MSVKVYDELHWVNYSSYDDLKLYEVGWHECDPGYKYGPIARDKYILHYVYEGEGTLCIEDREFSVKAGQAFLIPPKTVSWYQASEENPWHYIWIQFHGFKVMDMAKKAGFTKKTPVYIPLESGQKVGDCLREIFENYDEEFACIGNVYRLFQLIKNTTSIQIPEEERTVPYQEYVQKSIEYMTQKYSEPIRISDIAKHCGLERSYMSKMFKEATGYTPQEYLMEYRMNKAKQLLKDTDMPVQHVSYSVGYNDPFAFSKLFKKEVGMSPTEYRKEILQ